MTTYVQASVASFPISFSADEYPAATYRAADELAADIEFLDDTESYVARDASGRRVRLLVSEMRLLLCQVVPDGFSASQLVVLSEHDPTGTLIAEHEILGDAALRSVLVVPMLQALPAEWSESSNPPNGPLRLSQRSPRDFDNEWRRIKVRQLRRKRR